MCMAYAKRMEGIRASEIREILKITQREEVISFAGGLPAPELFPVAALKDIAVEVLEMSGKQALQYSTTEGYEPLRNKIAERMNRKFHAHIQAEQVLITCGSQQALDFIGKLFLDEGDVVLCESPTYLAAISAFSAGSSKRVHQSGLTAALALAGASWCQASGSAGVSRR